MSKRKDMRRTDWTRILKREYVWKPCQYQGYEGIVSLISIQKITQPLVVQNGDHYVTIVDEGMSWLQIALDGQHVWTTAMFDREGKLLQVYFDITDGNCLIQKDNPTFEDMYLDVVMEPDGTLYVLDRDELDEAFEAGIITTAQYERTIAEGERLYQWLTMHGLEWGRFCCEQMSVLKRMSEASGEKVSF